MHEAVVDVAVALAAEPRRALAAQALDACRGACPAGTRSVLRPLSVGTSTSAPRSASGIVSGTSTSTLSPLRLKTGDVLHVRDDVEVAARAAVAARLALAGEAHPASPRARRRGC